jgi:hypothetical protein
MSAARWQLEDQKARLLDVAIEASIDLAHPERGLSLALPEKLNGGSQLSVLGFTLESAYETDRLQIDPYARENDLIATFERAAPWPMHAQVYWRRLEPKEFAPEYAAQVVVAFDLIASVNTSLLDANPASTVRSSLKSAIAVLNLVEDKAIGLQAVELGSAAVRQVHQIGQSDSSTGCFLARLANGPLTWIEMVHPIDFRGGRATFGNSGSLSGRDAVSLVHGLFEQRLEKGVILRARVRGALVKRANDVACAMAAFARFSAAEPSLTV